MGHFNLFKSDKNGEWYFNLMANNNKIITASQGYNSKQGAEKGIESVKENASDDSKYDRRESKNDQYYFNLKAANGEIIGTSETYTTKQSMENGIESVKANAVGAEVKVEG